VRWIKGRGRVDPARLVFIDETWTRTNLTPRRGWGPRGQRLQAQAAYGHWQTQTFLAALRQDRVEAPWLLDGAINRERFLLYVMRVLVPTLQPGDIVVMDNLGSHRNPCVRATVRAAGAKLFLLPKYSPDLNPIEQLFANIKHLLRKAGARSADAISAAIGQILDTITPQECSNYLAHAGYAGYGPN
jgi:putative transposase